MKKLILAAVAAAMLTLPAMASAQQAPRSGVTDVQQEGDIIYVQVSTPIPAKLEIASGNSDPYQADIPAGTRRIGIPRAEVAYLLDDRNDDVFLIRFADGTPSQVGARVPASNAFDRMAASNPYRVSYTIKPGDEAERDIHGFVITNN
jgi:hypothetical protein